MDGITCNFVHNNTIMMLGQQNYKPHADGDYQALQSKSGMQNERNYR